MYWHVFNTAIILKQHKTIISWHNQINYILYVWDWMKCNCNIKCNIIFRWIFQIGIFTAKKVTVTKGHTNFLDCHRYLVIPMKH